MSEEEEYVTKVVGKVRKATLDELTGKLVNGEPYFEWEVRQIRAMFEKGDSVANAKKKVSKHRNYYRKQEVKQVQAKVAKQVKVAVENELDPKMIEAIKAQVPQPKYATKEEAQAEFERLREEWVAKLQNYKYFENPPPVVGPVEVGVFYPNIALMNVAIMGWDKQDKTSTFKSFSSGMEADQGNRAQMAHAAGAIRGPVNFPDSDPGDFYKLPSRTRQWIDHVYQRYGVGGWDYQGQVLEGTNVQNAQSNLDKKRMMYYATMGFKHSTKGAPIHFPIPKPLWEDETTWKHPDFLDEALEDNPTIYDFNTEKERKGAYNRVIENWRRYKVAWDWGENARNWDIIPPASGLQGARRGRVQQRPQIPKNKRYYKWLDSEFYLEQLKDEANWDMFNGGQTIRLPEETQEDPHGSYSIGQGEGEGYGSQHRHDPRKPTGVGSVALTTEDLYRNKAPLGDIRWLNPFYIVNFTRLGLCYIVNHRTLLNETTNTRFKEEKHLIYFGKLPYKVTASRDIQVERLREINKRHHFVKDLDVKGLFMGADSESKYIKKINEYEDQEFLAYANDILNLDAYGKIGEKGQDQIKVACGSGHWITEPTFWRAGPILHGDASNVVQTLSKGEVVLGVNNLLEEVNPYNIVKEEDDANVNYDFIGDQTSRMDGQKRSTTHMINRVVQTILQFNQLRGIFKQNTTPAQIRNGEATGTIEGTPDKHWADDSNHPLGRPGDAAPDDEDMIVMVAGAFYGCQTTLGKRRALDDIITAIIYPVEIKEKYDTDYSEDTGEATYAVKRVGENIARLKDEVLARLIAQRSPLPIWSTMEALTTKARHIDNFAWDQLASIGTQWCLRQTIEECENNQLAWLSWSDFDITGEKPPPTYAKDQMVGPGGGTEPTGFSTMCYEWLSGLDNAHKPHYPGYAVQYPDPDGGDDLDEDPNPQDTDEALTKEFSISHWAYEDDLGFLVNVGGFVIPLQSFEDDDGNPQIHYEQTMGKHGERVVGCFHSAERVTEVFTGTGDITVDYRDIIWGDNMDLMGFNPHAFNRDSAKYQVHDWMDPTQVATLPNTLDIRRLSNEDAVQKLGQFRVDHTHTIKRSPLMKTVKVDKITYRTDADQYLYDMRKGGKGRLHEPEHRVGQLVGTGVVWQSPAHQYEHLQRNYESFQKAKTGNFGDMAKLRDLPLSPLTHPYHFVAQGGQVL